MGGNEDDFPIKSPNGFDRACYTKMNDEFWITTDNYLSNSFYRQLINIIWI